MELIEGLPDVSLGSYDPPQSFKVFVLDRIEATHFPALHIKTCRYIALSLELFETGGSPV